MSSSEAETPGLEILSHILNFRMVDYSEIRLWGFGSYWRARVSSSAARTIFCGGGIVVGGGGSEGQHCILHFPDICVLCNVRQYGR